MQFGTSPALPQIVPFNFGEDEVNFDDTVTATCTIAKGDLPIHIWWTLSDSIESLFEHNITSNDGIIISKTGNKLSVLNIEVVKARHRGNYSCYAKNKAGTAKHSAFLSVKGLILLVLLLFSPFKFIKTSFAICFFLIPNILLNLFKFSLTYCHSLLATKRCISMRLLVPFAQ